VDYVLDRLDVIGAMREIGRLTGKWPVGDGEADRGQGERAGGDPRCCAGKIGGLIAVEPEGGKVSRAYAAQPEVEAGNVFLPHPALYGWVEGFIGSCAAFPNAANDDDVDAFTQTMIRWQGVTAVTGAEPQVTSERMVAELFG
jgi:predicted phage terminase large subunit-like protein